MSAVELMAHGEGDMRRIGECLALGLRADSGDAATVVALDGELGAGKTRLVRGIAAGLGVSPEDITSPTFVLAMAHTAGELRLVHVDAWRIGSTDDLHSLGWDELLASPGTVVVIEWASRVASELPSGRVDVAIDHVSETSRRVTVTDRRSAAASRAMADALALYESTEARGAPPSLPRCPICRATLTPSCPTAPFCSSRCRTIDLGRWFGGGYRVSRPLTADDELSE